MDETVDKQELLAASLAVKNELKETWIKAPDVFDVASQNSEFAIDVKDFERTQQNSCWLTRR